MELNADTGNCEDIDECMDVNFTCDPNAMCVNDIMDVAKVSFDRLKLINYYAILLLLCNPTFTMQFLYFAK